MSCKGGCTCHNSTDYQPCTPEPTCYNGCTSSPCAYAVLSKCQFGIGVDAQGRAFDENVFTRHITTLWRHCLYDENNAQNGIGAVKGTWSARKNCGGLNPLGPFRGGKVDNSECVAVGQEYDVVPHNPKCDGNYIGDMIFGCDTTNQTSCTGCTWSAFELSTSIPVWELTVGGPAPGGGGPGPPSTPVTASLNVYVADCAIPGTVCLVASYSNDAFSCLGRTTFTKAGSGCFPNYQDIYNKLPQQVCLVPYASNWIHPCGTDNSEICDCRDDGCSSFPLDLTVTCNEQFTIDPDFIFERIGGSGLGSPCLSDVGPDNVDLCGCVTFPSSDCGYFAGAPVSSGLIYIDCGSSEPRILLPIIFCDGGEWTLQMWCITYTVIVGGYTNLVCTLADEVTLNRTNDCEMTFDPATVDVSGSDCCEACGVTVCGCSLPTTLVATLSSSCAQIDADTITLTWDGVDSWDGTYVPGGGCDTLSVTFAISSAGLNCIGTIVGTSGSGECFNLQSAPFAATVGNCESVLCDDPGTWNNFVGGCSCCGIDSLTITVTP